MEYVVESLKERTEYTFKKKAVTFDDVVQTIKAENIYIFFYNRGEL